MQHFQPQNQPDVTVNVFSVFEPHAKYKSLGCLQKLWLPNRLPEGGQAERSTIKSHQHPAENAGRGAAPP